MSIPDGLFLSLGLVSLVENVLVVAAIAKNRNLHSPMYYFVCCLAVSDLLVSVSNVLETAVLLLLEAGALAAQAAVVQQLDNVMNVLICGSMVSSLCFLGAIAVDRYVSIFYALRYHSIMTVRKAGALIAAIWVCCGVCGVVFIVYSESKMVIVCLVVIFFAMLLLMGTLYVHMFLFARLHVQRIAALPPADGGPPPQRSCLKGAVTISLLLGVFIFCWAPFFLHLVLIITCPTHPYCICYTAHFNTYLVLIMCNSVIDPLIYAFRSLELRNTFKEILCSCNA